METKQQIEFQKVRNFNELFSDTFAFLRGEMKPLFRLLLIYVLPAALIVSVISGWLNANSLNYNIQNVYYGYSYQPMSYYIFYFILIISSIIFSTIARAVPFAYMSNYFNNNGIVEISKVKADIKNLFFKYLGFMFAIGIVVILAFVPAGIFIFLGVGFLTGLYMLAFIIGVLYFAISISLGYAAIAFEKLSVADAVNRSMKLIKGKWWYTLGILILFGLIVYIVTLVFEIPSIIILGVNTFLEISQPGEPAVFGTAIIIIVSAISSLGFLSSVIIDIFTALHFFNLREQKEARGISAKIDSLAEKLAEPRDDINREDPERFMPRDSN